MQDVERLLVIEMGASTTISSTRDFTHHRVDYPSTDISNHYEREIMNPRQVVKMLDQAFKDRAPNEYRQMKQRGELATYLNELASQAAQSYSTATNSIPDDLAKLPESVRNDPIERVQQANMKMKAAEEVALSQALEALPMESQDEDETAEPMSLYDLTGDYWREKMLNETAAPSTRHATTASSRRN